MRSFFTAVPRSEMATGGCAVMGQTGSGKTRLLMAIHRSCNLQMTGQPSLDFTAKNAATHTLIRDSVDAMMGNKDLFSSQVNVNYEFEISKYYKADREKGLPPRESRRFRVTDGPGEALFPPNDSRQASMRAFTAELLEQGRRAHSIILCVSAGTDKSLDSNAVVGAAQLEIYRQLAARLGEMSTKQELFPKNAWKNLLHEKVLRRSTSEPVVLERLACDRFLLLLTKVDQVATIAFRKLDQTGRFVPQADYFRPSHFAELLSPVAQARQLLGIEVLNTIRGALRPGADFAVGVSSAGGFDSDGSPFLNDDGKPVGKSSISTTEVLSRWRPFGIREAITYAAFGDSSSTVERVTAAHLRTESIGDLRITSV